LFGSDASPSGDDEEDDTGPSDGDETRGSAIASGGDTSSLRGAISGTGGKKGTGLNPKKRDAADSSLHSVSKSCVLKMRKGM